jgi:hypothetical protein
MVFIKLLIKFIMMVWKIYLEINDNLVMIEEFSFQVYTIILFNKIFH